MNSTLTDQLRQLLEYQQLDPGNPSLILDIADIYLQLNQATDADGWLAKLAPAQRRHPKAQFQQACIAMAKLDFASARRQLADLFSAGIDNLGVRYNLALSNAMLGDMQACHELLAAPYQSGQLDFPAGIILLMKAKHHLGELEPASEMGRRLLRDMPDDGDLLGELSLLALDTAQLGEAKKYAESAQRQNPDNIESLVVLGSMQLGQHDALASAPYFDRALAIKPDEGRALLGKGLCDLMALDGDNASAHLSAASRQLPDNYDLWIALAWAYILQDKIDDAYASTLRAQELDDHRSEAFSTLAILCHLRGNKSESDVQLGKAFTLDADCPIGLMARELFGRNGLGAQDFRNVIQQMFSGDGRKHATLLQQSLIQRLRQTGPKKTH